MNPIWIKCLVGRQILIIMQAFEINALLIEGVQSCSLHFFAEGKGKECTHIKKKKKNKRKEKEK